MMIDIRGISEIDARQLDLIQALRHSDDTRRYRCRPWFHHLVRFETEPAGWMLIRSLTHVARLHETCEIRIRAKESCIMTRLIQERDLAATWDVLKSDAGSSRRFFSQTNVNWNCVYSADANRERRGRDALNWKVVRFYEKVSDATFLS